MELNGNVSEPKDACGSLEKSSLFFLTTYYPGSNLLGDRVMMVGKVPYVLRYSMHSHWPVKIWGIDLFAHSVVLQTASGLQGE